MRILNRILTYSVGCIYNTDAVDRVKYAYNQGHQVASHTWAHKDLTTLSFDQSMCTPFLFRFRDQTNYHPSVQDEMLGVERESLIHSLAPYIGRRN